MDRQKLAQLDLKAETEKRTRSEILRSAVDRELLLV
ncbi:MAG: ribbon-helix-helix protein, CopG family [Propionibacteriaceae bacterium]|nr:ribbon-helix-helix protein, CopG family [Propionibacteriaceae bacterium]